MGTHSLDDTKNLPSAFTRLHESFTIFPLHGVRDGQCACGASDCDSPGKHPAIPSWKDLPKGVHLGPDGCNYAVATGDRSDMIAIDLDSDEATHTFASWGDLPPTLTIRTARGVHLYMKDPGGISTRSALRGVKGIDVRADGGYVVAPGSTHVTGHVYHVSHDVDPVAAPEWLLAILREVRRCPSPVSEGAPETDIPVEERIAKARELLLREPIAISKQDGHRTTIAVIGKMVRRCVLTNTHDAMVALQDWNARCEPPWGEQELLHKINDAIRSSPIPWGLTTLADREQAERCFEKMRVASLPPALRPVAGPLERQTPNPKHEYTFAVGKIADATYNPAGTTPAVVEDILTNSESWRGVLQYDEFRHRVLAVNPPVRLDAEKQPGGVTETDERAISSWFAHHGKLIGRDHVRDCVKTVAKHTGRFHPVVDYLRGLPPAKGDVLPGLATRIFGTKDALADVFLEKTLVAAVRRVLSPGCQVDTMLVLVGSQVAFKSSFVRELFGREFTRSQMPDLASKDASLALQGFWAVELAELDRVLRAETSTVKDFLSRTVDNFRPPYGRDDLPFPRQCVFIGTTNKGDCLRDETGDRRYWPVTVDHVDLDYVRAHRDLIWSEALALAVSDEPHWLSKDEEKAASELRVDYQEHEPWHDRVLDYVMGREFVVSANEVHIGLFGRDAPSKRDTSSITKSLRQLGCTDWTRKVDGARRTVLRVPEVLAKAAPSQGELERRTAAKAMTNLRASTVARA